MTEVKNLTRLDIERSLNIIIAEFIVKEGELPYCVIMPLNYYIKFIDDFFIGSPEKPIDLKKFKYKDVIVMGVQGIAPDCLMAGEKGLLNHVIKIEQARASNN